MTEAKLKELQQINATKHLLEAIMESFDDGDQTEVLISTRFVDMVYTEMQVKLYPEFYKDFASFIRQQYKKYKEAFDNA